MAEEEYEDYQNQIFGDVYTRIKDISEKQRILQNRLLLIGKNLIEIKEKDDERNINMRKEIEIIKRNVERLISFLETASNEMSKFARKEDVEILAKQARIFQPINKKK
jgi:hypothetical protein